ncbi:MAG: mechanosensitive ion channel family protein [Algoriphagus sp.]|jgi:small-conductance mechanosensitive channel|uniref:mechanosensitive ion channel family protein n=3 Tax=Algoriphagus sp. TaxID=1872435 RepID=UPI0027688045|nr:mechanosensitive ion channel family protein [Algoriphagus sp.]MDP4746991.1 mechanosensitive ion channel family protein [Algoriphagus sp.]MDP4903588.1 mechanosensitive ion channel family protein [Algoriphagus sp.]MDP4956272.1 mechanosensitive ion channel family protein [Algoriphagus sp.]MDP5125498.1 mechanosensitive ion channel family protein [Algoriphagus sp.]
MNHLKSRIRNKENVRKTYFAFKLIFLVILEVFYAGNTLISPFLVQYEILNHVIRALIFLLSTNLIFSLGRIITLRIYLQQREETKVQPNFVVGIDRIEFLLNLLAILISLMLAFGIRPLEFLTSITIVAAAIALLTKDYITNIVNGLIMMFSDQLEIGDKVQIGRHTGFIRDITLINLVLKNDAGEIILIPNTMALTTDVVNYSKNNTHQLIFDAELSFKKELHLTELERVLEVILEQYALVVQKEGAQLTLLDRKIDTVSIRYQFPIKSGEKETELQVKKSINQALIDWQYAVQKGELL